MPRPRLLRVLRLPLPELGRAVEAAVLFHAFRVVLRVVPIRRLTPLLGEAGAPDAPLDGTHTATWRFGGRSGEPGATTRTRACRRPSQAG